MIELLTILLTVVYLEHSNTLNFDKERVPDAQILVGDVIFRHDSAFLYCDSAYYFEKRNALKAMGRVHLEQGDTVNGYGDILYYDGDTKFGRFRRHVKLINKGTTLTTDSLDYDRTRNLAWYFHGGKIVDSLNVLTSQYGQYKTSTSQAIFRNKVHLVNDNFTLDTDTLNYNTESHLAELVARTTILYGEETQIYAHSGWYNTETELSSLYDQAKIVRQEGRTLTADTIYLDKPKNFAKSYGRALLEEYSDSVYTYIHGDTIFTEDIAYKAMIDSQMVDTTYQKIVAYHHVRLYREDAQLICDSLRYISKDSMSYAYGDPICWNENNQMSADSVHMYVQNGAISMVHGMGNALVAQQGAFDSTCYNQVGGKEMTAYVRDQEVHLVEFKGNAETIFYPDEDGEYIGMNSTQSSNVTIYLQDQEIEHIRLTSESSGTLYPIDQIPPGKDKLSSFFWAADRRPTDPMDVLRITSDEKVRPERVAVSASAPEEETPTADEKKKEKKKENRNRKSAKK